MEYLGSWLTHYGVKTINKNIESIKNMKPPPSQNEFCTFISLVSYYHNMWSKFSHTLEPLNNLISRNVKLKWTDAEQKTFDKIKHIV